MTEEVGRVAIVEPGTTGAKTLHEEQVKMPEGRFAEIWGSVAVAYGRLYVATENGLHRQEGRTLQGHAQSKEEPASGPPAVAPDAKAARITIVPAEVIGKAGEPVAFKAWAFDAKGRPSGRRRPPGALTASPARSWRRGRS